MIKLLIIITALVMLISCSSPTECGIDLYSSELSILSPVGNEKIEVGSISSIKWKSSGITLVKIELSVDNGKSWETIADYYPANNSMYPWIVPDRPSNKALIRIIDANNYNVRSVSKQNFYIKNKPFFYINSPLPGVVWREGSIQSIIWTATEDRLFNLEVYSTVTENWTMITELVESTSPEFYLYDWEVPEGITGNVKLRFSLSDNENLNWKSEFFFVKPYLELPEFININQGVYTRGSSNNEGSDNSPEHEIWLDSFLISIYPVTQDVWEEVTGNNPSIKTGQDLPVENISWFQAVYFCNELSRQLGYEPAYMIEGNNIFLNLKKNGFRLPTEAEWEVAAKGKYDNYNYSGSDNPYEVAWFTGNSSNETKPVGQLEPNNLGLYDMSGNVWEWCWDGYEHNFYSNEFYYNPYCQPADNQPRVIRGGSFFSLTSDLKILSRNKSFANQKSKAIGLRLVRSKIE